MAAGVGLVALACAVSAVCAGEAVDSASRSVIVHLINNSSDILIKSMAYTVRGYCYTPPETTVFKGVTATCSFGNEKGAVRGAAGVMTYDIMEHRKKKVDKRLAIMYSVPFDYNFYENWFALGFFGTDQECDRALYDLMYYKEGEFKREKASGSPISFHRGNHALIGTMSPAAKAEMIVELRNVV